MLNPDVFADLSNMVDQTGAASSLVDVSSVTEQIMQQHELPAHLRESVFEAVLKYASSAGLPMEIRSEIAHGEPIVQDGSLNNSDGI